MLSQRQILTHTRDLLSTDAETRQAIQERIDDAMAELFPDGTPAHQDEDEEDRILILAIERALEACPE